MKLKNLILLSLILIASLPFVSAYNGWGGWYGSLSSPYQLLENEWVLFGLIFLVFFAILFFSLGRTMSGNTASAAIVSAVISFFAAAVISQRAYFYGYIGEGLGSLVTTAVLILLLLLLIKALTGVFGGWFLFLSLSLLSLFSNIYDPYYIIPYEFVNLVTPIYDFLAIAFWPIFIISVIALIAAIGKSEEGKGYRWWFWHGHRKRGKFTGLKTVFREMMGD